MSAQTPPWKAINERPADHTKRRHAADCNNTIIIVISIAQPAAIQLSRRTVKEDQDAGQFHRRCQTYPVPDLEKGKAEDVTQLVLKVFRC